MCDKAILRKELRARLAALTPAQRAASDAAIWKKAAALPEVAAARRVFCYISVGAEVATHGFIEQLLASGCTVYAPRCYAGGVMEARQLTGFASLVAGWLGIPQPPASSPLIQAAALDLVILPCLGFDDAGYRLGQGGGYYDRYLAGTHCPTLLVARGLQRLPALPHAPHDIPVRLIATDEAVPVCRLPAQV